MTLTHPKVAHHVYHTSLDISHMLKDADILAGNDALYTHLFFHLKSQCTFLTRVCTLAKKCMDKMEENEDKSVITQIIEIAENLLNTKYGFLLNASYETVEKTRALLSTTSNKKEMDLLTQLFTISVSISRTLIRFCSKDFTKNEWDHESGISHVNDDEFTIDSSPLAENQERLIVCRICNEHVPVSLIEQHTHSCMAAYNSEAKISAINQKIELLTQKIATTTLDQNWPNEQKNAIKNILPILHFNLLMERASQIETRSSDAVAELDKIGSTIYWMKIDINKTEAKKLLLDKINVCVKIEAARDVLRKTRVSGNDQTTIIQPIVADFILLRRISSGAYARVYLAKKRQTGDTFAIKVIPKSNLQEKNQMRRILTEKNILLQFYNPFVTNFYYSIIGKHNLYLVMEYIPGGDLYSLLQRFGSFDEESAKVYTFQIAKALKYLYENGIIHRDLKPDNILVTKDGFLKLADFGLSYIGVKTRNKESKDIPGKGSPVVIPPPPSSPKSVSKSSSMSDIFDTTGIPPPPPTYSLESVIQSKSIVGTPDYISPEIVLGLPHSFTTDYWSLGVIVYEMLNGIPPFHDDNEKMTCERVVQGKYEPIEDISPEATDFIARLLQTDPKRRLGARGPDEILQHPWLKNITEDNLYAPWEPEKSDLMDTVDNFEERYSTNESVLEIPEDINEDILDGLMHARRLSEASDNITYQRKSSDTGSIEDSFASEDDLSQFPSVHIAQLVKQNEDEAQRTSDSAGSSPSSARFFPIPSERTMSFSGALPQGSHFLGLSPSSSFGGKKRKIRKMSFSGVNAADDYIVNIRKKYYKR